MQGLLAGATPAGGAPPGGQAGSPRPTGGGGGRVTPPTKRLRTGVMKIRPTNVDEATAAFNFLLPIIVMSRPSAASGFEPRSRYLPLEAPPKTQRGWPRGHRSLEPHAA